MKVAYHKNVVYFPPSVSVTESTTQKQTSIYCGLTAQIKYYSLYTMF